jgi:transcriptional repressor NrdR
MVLARLKDIDTVSYIRFASVYREFQDIDSFISEINSLDKRDGKRKLKKREEKND